MSFHFEDHVLDPALRELWQGSKRINVEPRVFDLLVYLIENRNRLVTKDDLIADIWGGAFVTDSALATAIYAARRAIGDDGRAQRLIRTSARKGIRFVATILLDGT